MRYVGFLAALLGTIGLCSSAHAKVIQEVVDLPVEVNDARGVAVKQTIKVTILREDSRAKAAFLILNHGRSGKLEWRRRTRVGPYLANARYFVAKGFTVFLPIRIGYGESGGPDIENTGTCSGKNYVPGYEAAAVQIAKVIDFAKSLPHIDPAKGIVVGQSFGGTAAIGIAAKNISGVVAAVNFAAGGGGRPETHPGQPCRTDLLKELFAKYGDRARIPTIWFYSENDKYWGADLPRAWHQAFIGRGGIAEFVKLPPYKEDGHPSFTGAPQAWRPQFEAFLGRCCTVQRPDREAKHSTSAASQRNGAFEAFTHALTAWSSKHGVAQAAIVVRIGGRIVHQAGLAGADPASPVLLASLSKAITGACVATLVRDGAIALDWPLSKALRKFFGVHGMPKDSRIGRVTVAQLLTHRAGFSSASDGADPATRSLLDAYLGKHSTRAAPTPHFISTILNTTLLRDPGVVYAYSNAGYFILGAVVEEASGRGYESFCRERVLAPAGVTGSLDPVWAVLWSAGGWRMTGADYLAVLEHLDPKRVTFGEAVRDWMLISKGKTYGLRRPQSWYGPGLRLRNLGQGIEIWHTGSWRRKLAPDHIGPRSTDTRTFAMRLADGTSWFVHHSAPANLDIARNELDRDLRATYRRINASR